MKADTVALAAEPNWIELPREELKQIKLDLSALLGRNASAENTKRGFLKDEEAKCLEKLWAVLNEVLS